MAKLSLTANPTFPGKVEIPIAGLPSVEIGVTFKHRTRTEFAEWNETLIKGKPFEDAVMECITAWEFDDPLTKENVAKLSENYMGAPLNIINAYSDELLKAKAKN